MARKNTSRGDYYREKAREEADEFFDAPEEYRSNFKNTQEEARKNKEKAVFDADEPTSGRGKIAAITVDSSAETNGFGTRCMADEAYLNQFIGKTCPVQASDIDAIAGATVTTNAVLEALNAAYDLVK